MCSLGVRTANSDYRSPDELAEDAKAWENGQYSAKAAPLLLRQLRYF